MVAVISARAHPACSVSEPDVSGNLPVVVPTSVFQQRGDSSKELCGLGVGPLPLQGASWLSLDISSLGVSS